MKTIRIQLHGGLGNQLFIWAAAHDIAKKNKCKVKLVYIEDRQQRTDRPIEMRKVEDFCTHSISVSTSRIWGIIFKTIDKINIAISASNIDCGEILGIYSLANSYEVPDILSSNTVMVRGYFQESKMVSRVTGDLLLEITKTLEAIEIEEKYTAGQSLHIRRGDTTSIGASWGILSLKYFDRTLISDLKTVLCTDSQEIRDAYFSKYPSVIVSTSETHNSWQTLKILTQADRFIGSNSTLSWWAAWIISHNHEKVAVLPSPWRPQDQKATAALILDEAKYEIADFEEIKI